MASYLKTLADLVKMQEQCVYILGLLARIKECYPHVFSECITDEDIIKIKELPTHKK